MRHRSSISRSCALKKHFQLSVYDQSGLTDFSTQLADNCPTPWAVISQKPTSEEPQCEALDLAFQRAGKVMGLGLQ